MHPNRVGSQKASTSSRDKSQCHYHWLLSLLHLSATFTGSNLITCSFSFSPVEFGELPLDQAYCLSGWTNPSWSWLPCSSSPLFCSSTAPWELSPVLWCGSLSLSPSVRTKVASGWIFSVQEQGLCNYFEFKVKFSWDCAISEHNKQLDLDFLDSDYCNASEFLCLGQSRLPHGLSSIHWIQFIHMKMMLLVRMK